MPQTPSPALGSPASPSHRLSPAGSYFCIPWGPASQYTEQDAGCRVAIKEQHSAAQLWDGRNCCITNSGSKGVKHIGTKAKA